MRAVEEDLEYSRTKRLEPRIFRMARSGRVTTHDILRAQSRLGSAASEAAGAPGDLESRIRALEDALDEYVKGIGVVSSDLVRGGGPIEDARKERSDYDEFFRIEKKHRGGTLERDMVE